MAGARGAQPGMRGSPSGSGNFGRYTITTFTSDVPHAGTDADVVLLLAGRSLGGAGESSLEATLRNSSGRNLFERGQEDLFEVEGAYLGELTGVTLALAPSTATAFTGKHRWHCAGITVLDALTSTQLTLRCGVWLSSKAGPDVQRSVSWSRAMGPLGLELTEETELPRPLQHSPSLPSPSSSGLASSAGRRGSNGADETPSSSGSSVRRGSDGGSWEAALPAGLQRVKVTVLTASDPGSSSDSSVRLKLLGDGAAAVFRELAPSLQLRGQIHRDLFETGQEDVFGFECPTLGLLRRVTLSVQPGRAASWTGKKSWQMECLRIEDLATGRTYTFRGQGNGWFRQRQWERLWDRTEGALGLTLHEESGATDGSDDGADGLARSPLKSGERGPRSAARSASMPSLLEHEEPESPDPCWGHASPHWPSSHKSRMGFYTTDHARGLEASFDAQVRSRQTPTSTPLRAPREQPTPGPDVAETPAKTPGGRKPARPAPLPPSVNKSAAAADIADTPAPRAAAAAVPESQEAEAAVAAAAATPPALAAQATPTTAHPMVAPLQPQLTPAYASTPAPDAAPPGPPPPAGPVRLFCAINSAGTPVMTRAYGGLKQPPFATVALIGSVATYAAAAGLRLRRVGCDDARVVFRSPSAGAGADSTGEDGLLLALVASDQAPGEGQLRALLDAAHDALCMFLGADGLREVAAGGSLSKLRRSALRAAEPLIDWLLSGTGDGGAPSFPGEADLPAALPLTADGRRVLDDALGAFSRMAGLEHAALLGSCTLLAATPAWAALSTREAALLRGLASLQDQPAVEMRLYLPQSSPDVPTRVLLVPVRRRFDLLLLTGPEPSLSEAEALAKSHFGAGSPLVESALRGAGSYLAAGLPPALMLEPDVVACCLEDYGAGSSWTYRASAATGSCLARPSLELHKRPQGGLSGVGESPGGSSSGRFAAAPPSVASPQVHPSVAKRMEERERQIRGMPPALANEAWASLAAFASAAAPVLPMGRRRAEAGAQGGSGIRWEHDAPYQATISELQLLAPPWRLIAMGQGRRQLFVILPADVGPEAASALAGRLMHSLHGHGKRGGSTPAH